jgi:hypothetical protein
MEEALGFWFGQVFFFFFLEGQECKSGLGRLKSTGSQFEVNPGQKD